MDALARNLNAVVFRRPVRTRRLGYYRCRIIDKSSCKQVTRILSQPGDVTVLVFLDYLRLKIHPSYSLTTCTRGVNSLYAIWITIRN